MGQLNKTIESDSKGQCLFHEENKKTRSYDSHRQGIYDQIPKSTDNHGRNLNHYFAEQSSNALSLNLMMITERILGDWSHTIHQA